MTARYVLVRINTHEGTFPDDGALAASVVQALTTKGRGVCAKQIDATEMTDAVHLIGNRTRKNLSGHFIAAVQRVTWPELERSLDPHPAD